MSPVLRHRSDLTGSEVWEGDCRAVAEGVPDGSCSLAILDGAYGCGKSKVWDSVKVADLPEWYAPHLDDVGRVCGPSASLYVWNTAEGWAALHPGILAQGWTFRALVVWDKANSPAQIGWRRTPTWPESHEVCGFYTRGGAVAVMPDSTANTVWQCSTKALSLEQMKGPQRLAKVAAEGVMSPALHPCQKPIAFAERILRASSRPGESVWVPFGGTIREAVAAERIARADPAEARRVITAELNQDGVDYIGPALRQLRGEGTQRRDPRQADLFGGAP